RVDLPALPLVGAEHLAVAARLAERPDVVEAFVAIEALVLHVREELPALLDRLVASPVVRQLDRGPRPCLLRLDLVADEMDLVLEVDVRLLRVRRDGVEDVGLEPLLVLGADLRLAADARGGTERQTKGERGDDEKTSHGASL